MKLKLIEAPIGLFTFKNILCIKTEYSNIHSDKNGTFTTPDCYTISGGEYFWGNAKEARERNELIVEPVDAIIPVYCTECIHRESAGGGRDYCCDNMCACMGYCSVGERKENTDAPD